MKNYLATVAALAFSGAFNATAFAQSTVYMNNWQPKAAAMHCIDASQPMVNGVPAFSPLNDACINATIRQKIVGDFADVATKLESGSMHNPDYLRPVTSDKGFPALVLYVQPGMAGYAGYGVPCLLNGTINRNVNGRITFTDSVARLGEKGLPTAVLTHELVHASQFASPFALGDPNFCKGTSNTDFLNWIREGAADAIAWEYVRNELPTEWKVLLNPSSSQWRRAAGLRPFDYPLQFLEAKLKIDTSRLWHKHPYYVSSFWRHLAWRYHGDDIFYLNDFSNTQIVAPFDWTKWADDILKKNDNINPPDPSNPGKTRQGFYTTYPTFIADWASIHTNKRFDGLSVTRDLWLREMFGKCPTVKLNKGFKRERISFDLRHLSAQCFKLQVTNLRAGEKANIKLMGWAPDAGKIEELHVSEVERVGGGNFNCAGMLDTLLQGGTVVAGYDCVVPRTIHKAPGNMATFDATPLYGSSGADYVIFAVSRVKRDPVHDDADPAKTGSDKFHLDLSIDFATASIGGETKPAQPGLFDSRLWADNTLPMDISHQALAAQEGKLSIPGFSMPEGFAGPVTMETFTAINPVGEGAWAISLDTYEVTTEQTPFGPSSSYEQKETVTFYVEPGTQLTEGQSYEAYTTYAQKSVDSPMSLLGALTNSGASPPAGQDDFEPTILTVTESSDEGVTFEYSGRLCMGPGVTGGGGQSECLDIKPISGVYAISYPELYTVDGLLTYDQASEGNRIYRDNLASAFNRNMAMAFGGAADGGGGPSAADGGGGSSSEPSASGGEVSEECDCSCDGFEALMAMAEDPSPSSRAAEKAVRCSIKCAREYAACER